MWPTASAVGKDIAIAMSPGVAKDPSVPERRGGRIQGIREHLTACGLHLSPRTGLAVTGVG